MILPSLAAMASGSFRQLGIWCSGGGASSGKLRFCSVGAMITFKHQPPFPEPSCEADITLVVVEGGSHC